MNDEHEHTGLQSGVVMAYVCLFALTIFLFGVIFQESDRSEDAERDIDCIQRTLRLRDAGLTPEQSELALEGTEECR